MPPVTPGGQTNEPSRDEWTAISVPPFEPIGEQELGASIDALMHDEVTPHSIATAAAQVDIAPTSVTVSGSAGSTPVVAAPRPELYRPFIVCPECRDEIRTLRYSCDTTGREYGDALIGQYEIEDHERGDSDTDDTSNYTYSCSNCDEEITEEYIEANAQGEVRVEPRGRFVTAGQIASVNSDRDEAQRRRLYGYERGFALRMNATPAERDEVEAQKPDTGADDIQGNNHSLELEMILKFGCECPNCGKMIQVAEPTNRSRNQAAVIITHTTCPGCGHEFKLSDIAGNNHASRY